MPIFPQPEWLEALHVKLNSDENYAQIARNWEGDLVFKIDADESLSEPVTFYLDLWHGKCRDAYLVDGNISPKAALILTAPYGNYTRLLKGELEPIEALLTRKISLQGNIVLIMRNIPTVLDFVRCAKEITGSYI